MSTETATGGDDLRSTITAAMNEPEIEEAPEEGLSDSEGIEPEVKEKPSRDRDESGRFKPKEKAEEIKAPEKVEQKVSEQTKEEKLSPPQEWSGHAKVRWDGLPRAIQEELINAHKQISEQRTRTQGLEQILEPRRNLLAANYGSMEQGINYLFQVSDFAEKDPNGFLKWFAQQRGINLQAFTPQEGQPEGTQLQAALNEIQTLKQQLQGLQTNITSQSNNSMQAQIDAFASDPSHPYFNDVRLHMSALMSAGAAKDMETAYNEACWANPRIRAELQQQEFERLERERKQKAEQAKKAAGSIGGSPEGGLTPGDEPASTLREELLRNMRAQRV